MAATHTIRRSPLLLGLGLGILALWSGLEAGSDAADAWNLAARYTARVGLPVFLLVYAASSLLRHYPHAVTKAIMRDRRWWGLGFAAVHSAHLCALTNYFKVMGEPIPPLALYGGGAAYVLMYAMALTSFPAAQRALGIWWRRLHSLGIHYLWAVMTVSYAGKAVGGIEPLVSVPFALIAVGAMALRIKARRKVL